MFGTPAAGLNGVARPTGTSRCTTSSTWPRSSRSRPTSSSCTRCAWRRSTTSSPPSGSATSRCPSGAGSRWRRRGDAATRTSTAASTCATTAAARRSCWSTTPTPRPRCSRRRSCSGTGCKDVHPDDDQWNSLHEKLVERWGEITREAARRRASTSRWSRGRPTGEDHVTVAYLQETAAEAGLDTDRPRDRGHRLGLRARPLRRPRGGADGDGVQALPVGVDARRRLRQARRPQPARDDVDRAAVEDAAVQQGAARGAVGDVPGPPEPAARPTWTTRACSPSTSASRCSAARARTSRSSPRATRPRPAASTARRATSTSSSTRCRSSTATAPPSAPGSSATPPRGSASGRPRARDRQRRGVRAAPHPRLTPCPNLAPRSSGWRPRQVLAPDSGPPWASTSA